MGKQEKRDKASKKAKAQADAIVAETVEKVKRTRRSREATDGDRETAAQIKERRDAGMAWWQIAHELGLPGSADNVTQGKSGASKARSIYKKVYGDYPKTQRMRRAPDETLAGANGTRTRNSSGHEVVKAVRGKPIFSNSITDEELVTAIAGKKITWNLFLHNPVTGQEEFIGQDEQIVHESTAITVRQDSDGFRYVTFREGQGSDVPVEYRNYPGKYRSVFLHNIVKVAGTGRRAQTAEVKQAAQDRVERKRTRRQSRRKAVGA